MYFCNPDDAIKHKDEGDDQEDDDEEGEPDLLHEHVSSTGVIPPLNILILIVGSRGDVQPFIALAKGLQKSGHYIRMATHVNFRKFVNENGLEFFPLKGDPEYLMSFMVHHPDMITLDPSDIAAKQKMMEDIYTSTWQSATVGFKPDVIISNPPIHVHVHLAQRLQVPLHVMFTMPWSPTTDYKHPLAPLQHLIDNKKSYTVVDKMIWLGLGSAQNKYRKAIGLNHIFRGASLLNRLKVPMMYCMSPHLAPKPMDWANHIDVVGFWFLDLQTDYKPDSELETFLKAGDPPLYIGFGSIVVDDAKKLGKTVIDAIIKSGLRAVVSPGWAKIGEGMDLPENIKLIEDVPHDWLFQHCSMACHHGGAGTTAAGLRAGLPTIIVPFFGDQPFWGLCVHRMGVGPEPMNHKDLTVDKLADAFQFCTRPEVKQKAAEMGEKLRNEDGVSAAVEAFQHKLPIHDGIWHEEIWENMRHYPPTGFTHVLLPTDRSKWSDRTGILELLPERYVLPANWEWISDWVPQVGERTDSAGWMYARKFKSKEWRNNHHMLDFVRTRKLIKSRRYIGPPAGQPPAFNSALKFVVFVTVKSAELYNTGPLSTYCKISVLSAPGIEATKIVVSTTTPVWDETLWIEVSSADTLVVGLYSPDSIGESCIGTTSIAVSQELENGTKEGHQLLDAQNQVVGKLTLDVSR